MQLIALNKDGKVIFIEDAERQQDYFCMECQEKVRVRGGVYRRDHFFHPTGSTCRQSQKSIEHIQVQTFFKENLSGFVRLEHHFPMVNRIADVVWEDEHIIFEVQCSSITAKEVEERNRDYARCGYQVIWVLHEKTFNVERVTAAEHFLRKHPHYFTNIDAEGKGVIYDQHAPIKRGRRFQESKKHPISLKLSRLKPFKGTHSRTEWPCKLESDLVVPEGVEDRAVKREGIWAAIKRFYNSLFQILLEGASR